MLLLTNWDEVLVMQARRYFRRYRASHGCTAYRPAPRRRLGTGGPASVREFPPLYPPLRLLRRGLGDAVRIERGDIGTDLFEWPGYLEMTSGPDLQPHGQSPCDELHTQRQRSTTSEIAASDFDVFWKWPMRAAVSGRFPASGP